MSTEAKGELSRTGRCVNANISQKMTACRRSAGSTRGSSLARGLTLLQARVIQRVVPHPVKVENIAKPQGQKRDHHPQNNMANIAEDIDIANHFPLYAGRVIHHAGAVDHEASEGVRKEKQRNAKGNNGEQHPDEQVPNNI